MTQAELAARAELAHLTEPVPSRDTLDRIRTLVGVLRERTPGGLRDVLDPVLAERDRALAGEISARGATILRGYDHLLLTALAMRYDALDRAVRDTTFAVAEIDGTGLISYANNALAAILPEAVGRDFAALFGPRAEDVKEALSARARKTLRLDLYSRGRPCAHLQGEIGPLSDEHDRPGAYALLLGLDAEEARFNALPDGIMRLDAEGNVAYASPRAEEIFGLSNEAMRGRPAASLFVPSGSTARPLAFTEGPSVSGGWKETVEVPDPHGNGTTPVRLTVIPYFDSAQSRSGFLLTIVPIAREFVSADLQKALSDPDCKPECLIRAVMRAVNRIIPYDLATFGVYTDDMRYHNTLVVEPKPEWSWTTAWFPLREESRKFLLGPTTWGGNLQATATALEPEINDDEVFKNIINMGMKGFVTLPISGGGQSVRASLTLLSRQPDRYDGREVEDMRELGVEKALLVAEANLSRRHVERAHQLQEQLANASGYRELAAMLANGISEYLGWDYVAVFALDRRARRFRLIAQHNATTHPPLRDDYEQPFTEGLLGDALRANAPQIVSNVDALSQENYKPVIPGRRSAVAMPIRAVRRGAVRAADEIEWILAVESRQRNAFQGPNMQSLDEALEKCETILRQRWHNFVQTSLLDAVEQALVFVDPAGKIRLTNPRANTLLGGGVLFGKILASFGAQASDKCMLESAGLLSQARLTLCIDEVNGVTVPTLATQRPVYDDYGHRLWLFTDLREQDYQKDSAYLEQTVNEVAWNARLPLMIASNLVRNAAQDVGGEPERMLNTAVRQLAKADITYERLASTLSARLEPDRPAQRFDALDVLREAVLDLPEEDLERCDRRDLDRISNRFFLVGWPDELKFAFRSVLAHLLVLCPFGALVSIAVDETNNGLLIVLSVPSGGVVAYGAPTPIDPIGAAKARARDAASLASEAVAVAVRRHDGEFAADNRGGTLAFRFELGRRRPLAE